jgi:hypothetical protein
MREFLAVLVLAAAMSAPTAVCAADAHSVLVAASNPEMQKIFVADQADRKDESNVDWKTVGPRDADRRVATRKLLDAGAIRSAGDYAAAAFVLAPGVLSELKRVTPRNEDGRPTARYFQSLTSNAGYPKLKEHLGAVVAFMRISKSWDEFLLRVSLRFCWIWPALGAALSRWRSSRPGSFMRVPSARRSLAMA